MLDTELLYQYEAVRQSGKANMFDRMRVHMIARKNGFNALAIETLTSESYAKLLADYQAPDQQSFLEWCKLQTKKRDIVRAILEENID